MVVASNEYNLSASSQQPWWRLQSSTFDLLAVVKTKSGDCPVHIMLLRRVLRRFPPISACSSRLRGVSSVATDEGYDHRQVEQKWQKYWDDNDVFKATRRPGHKKKYVLDMFPYPSGAGLHVGHPEGYTATDIMARYWRMNDYDVLHPMGWDAFGLPAEQYAIQTNTHPEITTHKNIAEFKRQLKALGFSYDWSREVSTTDTEFVKWTQWIFLQLFKEGLATQTEMNVNWCPALGTVLANEEVIDGVSERGGHPVAKLPLRQWVLHITKYAEELENGLCTLDWPEGTIAAQRQWIGRSEGARINFHVCDSLDNEVIEVFTTRPDTLFGVTFLVIAPEHELVSRIVSKQENSDAALTEKIKNYVEAATSASDIDRQSQSKSKRKTGLFTGEYARHPLTGEKVPIWIADFVLGSYGTGAVMCVPAHDARDYEFATTFELPIRRVLKRSPDDSSHDLCNLPFVGDGVVCNSPEPHDNMNGLSSHACKEEITRRVMEKGSVGGTVNYKLRDWGFSRQRYWGEPIPIYFPVVVLTNGAVSVDQTKIVHNAPSPGQPESLSDPRYGAPHFIDYDHPIAVPEEDLPLTLPPMEDFSPSNDPQGCLARAVEWRYFQNDGKWFARETNTMPQWAGSSWYYLRFADPGNHSACIGEKAEKDWLPVDLYVGGQEHAVLHLLYARFWHRVLHKLNIVSTAEPFQKVVHQGVILGSDGEKMSKSRGNVINPDEIVEQYGADALRLYEMFMGPLDATKPWQTSQVQGVVRFRDKVLQLVKRCIAQDGDCNEADSLLREMHRTIKKVTNDIENMSFNTAVSSLMIFSNHLASYKGNLPKHLVENLILLLSPIAPHCAEEFWQMLGNNCSLAYHTWPQYDESLCKEQTATVAVQVNGKKRDVLEAAHDCSLESILASAMDSEKVKKHTAGKEIINKIYVPGKILNIIVKARQ